VRQRGQGCERKSRLALLRTGTWSGVQSARAIGRDPSGSRVALTAVQEEDRTAQERSFRGDCPFALLLRLSPKDEGNEEVCASGSLSQLHPRSGHCHRDTRVSACSSARASLSVANRALACRGKHTTVLSPVKPARYQLATPGCLVAGDEALHFFGKPVPVDLFPQGQ